ncbi:hypothetical protein AB0O76_39830 [Streptomyces sp. NPDC086554]|uniref:hypothetical protein n=1 Tax=Streptomyces sp. NPDC086554 TaxID=3154864 RepID=UPI00342CE663
MIQLDQDTPDALQTRFDLLLFIRPLPTVSHIAVQPVTAEVWARYGGLRSEQLQARMLADGDEPDVTKVRQFCERARELFRAITDGSVEHRS